MSGGSSYYYDGDGNRVKEIDGSTTTLYINRYYEKNVTTSEVTTHYYLGGKQIAVRKGSTVSYLLQDHLGSTSVTASTAGASTSTIRYLAFGLTRSTSGTLPTDKQFTGQRLDSTGLYYYNARYYDPEIGRFISADTIVPNPANPQSLNRYSYCLNNPLKYTDPSGNNPLVFAAPLILIPGAGQILAAIAVTAVVTVLVVNAVNNIENHSKPTNPKNPYDPKRQEGTPTMDLFKPTTGNFIPPGPSKLPPIVKGVIIATGAAVIVERLTRLSRESENEYSPLPKENTPVSTSTPTPASPPKPVDPIQPGTTFNVNPAQGYYVDQGTGSIIVPAPTLEQAEANLRAILGGNYNG